MKLKKISISDYPALASFFESQNYELCEYTLPSILAWIGDDFQPLCFVNEEMLVICAEFAINKHFRHMLLPLSSRREFSPRELQDLALNLERDAFWFVPEQYIREHGKQEIAAFFDIAEQPGHADYIYRTEDLAQLKGNRYAKKRNLIRQFEREYANHDRIRVAPIDSTVADECIDFLEKWCEAYPCDIESDTDLLCEKQALICAMKNVDRLGLSSLYIRIDGEVSALGIGARLTDTMGVLHYEKAFTHVKGLYQYLDRECARRLFLGFQYLNKESDLELPGLIQAKKSYHPVKIMKSYRLTVR